MSEDKLTKQLNIWRSYFKNNQYSVINNSNISLNAFHITSNESVYDIFYYVKNGKKLATAVLTDLAFYYGETRFSLINLCKFCIYLDDNSILSLTNGKSTEYQINTNALKSFHDPNKSLYKTLVSLQNYLLAVNKSANSDRIRLFNYISSQIDNCCIDSSRLSQSDLHIILSFYSSTDYKAQAGIALSKYDFTIGNLNNFLYHCYELSQIINSEKLHNWAISYINQINISEKKYTYNDSLFNSLNLPSDIEKLRIEINKKLSGKESGQGFSTPKNASLSEILENTSNLSTSERNKAINKWNLDTIDYFKSLYQEVKDYSVPNSDTEYIPENGYGITLLHLAIILNNEFAYTSAYNSFAWNEYWESLDPLIEKMFNPIFVSAECGNDEAFNYFIKQTPEYLSLEKTLQVIKKKISKLLNPIIDIVPTARKKELLKELKSEEKTVKDEIDALFYLYRKKHARDKKIIIDQNDPFASIILEIYNCPSLIIEKGYAAPYRIISFCNHTYIVSDKWFSESEKYCQNNKYRKDSEQSTENSKNKTNSDKKAHGNSYQKASKASDSKKAQETKVVKPYGNSWFSPDAHKNLSALKKEYHKLIMKYHPDAPNGSADIFIDIQNERQQIIDSIPDE